jgi:GntR family transcriptional regulator
MQYEISSASRLPIYQQLVQQVREAIARGDLKPEVQLPSVRQLSRDLVINPNTVARGYTGSMGVAQQSPGPGCSSPSRKTADQSARQRRLLRFRRFLTEAVHLAFRRKKSFGSYRLGRDSFNGTQRRQARNEQKGRLDDACHPHRWLTKDTALW